MDLLRDNVKYVYLRYLFASIGSAVVMSVYSMVDAVALGRYAGGTGTAVMAVITPVWGIITFLNVLCGMGGAILMGKARGAGDRTESRNYFTVTFLLFALITAVLWAVVLLFGPQVLMLFGADRALLPHAMEYAKWIFWCFPVLSFSGLMVIFVRNDDAPNLAVAAVMAGGLFNVFGDWFFVFVMDMGISGAGFATMLGEVLQDILLFSRLLSPGSGLRFARPVRFWRTGVRVAATGFSAGLIDLANASLIILFNAQIMRYGDESTLAVYGVICSCAYLFMGIFSGAGQAAQPLISNNLGAGQPDRIRQTLRLAMAAELVIGVLLAGVGVTAPGWLVELFIGPEPELMSLAPGIIRPYFTGFLLTGVNVLAAYYFQCIMETRLSLTLSVLRGVVLSGALVLILPLFLDVRGIWLAMPLTELLTAVLALVCLGTFRAAERPVRTEKSESGDGFPEKKATK